MSENGANEEKPSPAPAGSLRDQRSWPMWPFALAIVLFIPLYTYLNLEYRKEGKAYEPFQAIMDRMNTIVEKNMYDWYGIKTERAENNTPIADPAPTTVQSGESLLDDTIPEQLKYYMPTRPILLPGLTKVEAPRQLKPGAPMRLRLYVPSGIAQDERLNLLTFYKQGDLYLMVALFVSELSEIEDSLSGEPVPVSFSIPTGPMGAATIEVRLLSEGRLSRWQMTNTAPFDESLESEDDSAEE